MNITKLVSTEQAVNSTPSTFSNANLLRVVVTTNTSVILSNNEVANSSTIFATCTVLAPSTEFFAKDPGTYISCNSAGTMACRVAFQG